MRVLPSGDRLGDVIVLSPGFQFNHRPATGQFLSVLSLFATPKDQLNDQTVLIIGQRQMTIQRLNTVHLSSRFTERDPSYLAEVHSKETIRGDLPSMPVTEPCVPVELPIQTVEERGRELHFIGRNKSLDQVEVKYKLLKGRNTYR